MLDKTIILVFIGFIFVGILTYQKVLTEKGEIPLLAKYIDRGGLAKMDEDETTRSTERNFSYRVGMQENIDRLNERFAALKAQQQELLENRFDHLDTLTLLTSDIQAQADTYAAVLRQEEQAFYDELEEMQALRREIGDLAAIPEGTQRDELAGRINAQLQAVFEAATGDPNLALPAFDAILERTETIVRGLDAECPDIETCLREHLADSEAQLEAFGDGQLRVPASDLSRLTELAAANTQQFKFLRYNVEATQGTLEENAGQLTEALADVSLLTQMTESDFREVVAVLEAIMDEQQLYLYNLALHQRNFHDEQQENSRKLNAIVGRLRQSPDPELAALAGTCETFEARRSDWMRGLEASVQALAHVPPPLRQAAAGPEAATTSPSAVKPAAVRPAYAARSKPHAVTAAARVETQTARVPQDPPAYYNSGEHMQRAREKNRENERRLQQLLETYRR